MYELLLLLEITYKHNTGMNTRCEFKPTNL
jgi:hypothetical protein